MKANNLKLGAIYKNGKNDESMRLINILPCEGVWMETYDGRGYGKTISFKDCHFANDDEVKDFLEDLETFNDLPFCTWK
jgi:hypothetical protein|tara:strand:- start:417 stop:653 length:237 start_codon:yes stop_codon:yes gene_type:complete